MQEILSLLDPDRLTTIVVTFIPAALTAVGILFAFWLFTRLTRPALRKALARADFDGTLITLLVDQVYRVVILLVGLIMAVSQLGVDIATAIAGLGIAGIAVGLAAQDTVANSIAGFLIFWDKPFRVGHVVESQGQYGQVTSITLRTTRVRTPDNTYVVIPNRKIMEDFLINHSMSGATRVRVHVGIAYGEDVDKARMVLLEAMRTIEEVENEPPPTVVVRELGDSSVNLEVRIWVSDASEERASEFDALEQCKEALDRAGIEMPFPHLQLHVDRIGESVWERAERFPRATGDSSSATGDTSTTADPDATADSNTNDGSNAKDVTTS